MRFLLLGPVTALHDGVPVDLGRRQERLLLGFLLLEPGRAIPLPRLVDLLWPDEPPPGARKAVQTYLACAGQRLRPLDEGRADGQRHHRITADGIYGPQTRRTINFPVDDGVLRCERFGA